MRKKSLTLILSCLVPQVRESIKIHFPWVRLAPSSFNKQIAATLPLFLSFNTLFFNPDNSLADSRPRIFNEVYKIVKDNFYDDNYNNVPLEKVKNDYLQQMKVDGEDHALTVEFLEMLGDKYTRLLNKAKFESIWKYDAIGVGLLFQSDPDKQMLVAAEPLAGSSSFKAGIHKNDVILSLNGVLVDKLTALEVLDIMSNDPRDEVVMEYIPASFSTRSTAAPSMSLSSLSSMENPSSSGKKTVVLKRSLEKVMNPVQCAVETITDTGERVGYIKLTEFNSEAVPAMEAALHQLEEQDHVNRLVLDLRGNLGGGFQFALNIGGMFMDHDMVTAIAKHEEKTVFHTSHSSGILSKKPLIVLTDALSASASEVLAAGLHDNCRAILSGTKTFGKGKIQAVFGLSNGEGMTMTVAQYMSPKGSFIQDRGIQPDIPLNDQINPYVKLIMSGLTWGASDTLASSDVSRIDYRLADKLLSMCQPPSSSSSSSSSSNL
jgi:carboxyl-terminal processing protease